MLYKVLYNNQSCKIQVGDDDDYDTLIMTIRKNLIELPDSKRLQLLVNYPPLLLVANGSDKITISSGSVINIREGDSPSITRSPQEEKDNLLSLIKINVGINRMLTKGYSRKAIEQALDISNNNEELAETICKDINDHTASINKTIKRVIIDADNSCLFNAIGYCACNNKTLGNTLRLLVAEEIKNNPDIYTSELLGKERDDYCQWIQLEKNWGGECEMKILSSVLDITICAIDIETNIAYKYENNNNNSIIYVIYDGIHYDSIALSNDDSNITIFDKDDQSTLVLIKQLALELKQQRQFVNINSSEIRCLVCSIVLKGQKEALEHATNTGHQNFSQA